MALERKDSVGDTTATTGTGTLTIAGVAVTGFLTFAAALTDGSTVRVRIQNEANTEWEVVEGVWDSGAATLTRDTVYASSNSGSKTSFSAGTKAVVVVMVVADFNGAQNLLDNLLERAMLKDCGLTVGNAKGSAGGSQAFDYTAGSVGSITPNATTTISITNWPPTGNRGIMSIKVTNAGAQTVNVPTTNWRNPDGTTTTTLSTYLTAAGITLQASGMNEFTWWTDDAGTTLYGVVK